MRVFQTISKKLLVVVQDIGLMVIAISTIIAIGIEIKIMVDAQNVRLADLLLLFIYLEVLAMVYIYMESGKLPIRIPLYIAIVALARYMILDMKDMDYARIIAVAVSTLVIALTVLVIRYGHIKFPYGKEEDKDHN